MNLYFQFVMWHRKCDDNDNNDNDDVENDIRINACVSQYVFNVTAFSYISYFTFCMIVANKRVHKCHRTELNATSRA